MPDLLDFRPLRNETVDTIRARMESAVNAGLDPGDPRWRDTTWGGWWSDHAQGFGLEAEYLWDYASTELPASFFLPFSWGIYLDYWGEMLSVPRNDPAAATGEATFTNTTANPVTVGAGIQVAQPAADVDSDPLIFNVTTGGVVPANGTLDLPVQADSPGSVYNVAAEAVSLVTSPLSGVTVVNANAITGGADEELDEPYKARLLLEFSRARGGGTKADYIAETLAASASVKHVTVQPYWAGPGTVRLIVTDENNDPVSAQVVAALQDYFDPVPANGDGRAPINATVTVATPATVAVTIVAAITHEPGFSLDGTGGTESTSAALVAAAREYIDSLEPGRDVQQSRVRSALLAVHGVYEVSNPTLNAVSADRVIAPLEVAQLGAVNLT